VKVVLVTHHGLPHLGGVEVLAHEEMCALAAAGHSVVHVTSDARGGSDVPILPDGCRQIRVPAWHVVERRAHLAYPLFGSSLVRSLRTEIRTADVVHAHGFIYETTAVAFALARLAGVPRILTDHGAIQQYHSSVATASAFAAANTVGRETCLLADRLVAYNDRVLDVMARLARPRSPETVFAPYPVRSSFRPPTGDERIQARQELGLADQDHPVIAYAGRLNPDKGADLVAQIGRDTGWTVLIQGAGDPAVLGTLTPNVRVLPPTDSVGVRRLYWAADVVVAPTVPGREGFPLVVREALAAGTPVVSSYEDGYRRYRGVSGLEFVDRDLASIVAGVRRVLEAGAFRPHRDPIFNPTPREWIRTIYGDYDDGELGELGEPDEPGEPGDGSAVS
jgi:glycosyltransferase involved in cell wall biosynthesis